MKNIKYTALLCAATTAFSLELEQAFLNGKLDGELRTFYMSQNVNLTSQAQNNTGSGFAGGGSLEYETNGLYGISAGAKFYTSQLISGSSNLSRPISITGYIQNIGTNPPSSYSVLGEAYAKGAYGKTITTVGRQNIDTPLLGPDDSYIIPNLFQAGVLDIKNIKDTQISVAYINGMLGGSTKDSYANSNLAASLGSSIYSVTNFSAYNTMSAMQYGVTSAQTGFNSMSRSAFGSLVNYNASGSQMGDTPMIMLGLDSAPLQNLKLKAYYYNNLNILQAAYFDIKPSINFEDYTLNFGAQYYGFISQGAGKTVFGALPNPNNPSQNLTLNYGVTGAMLNFTNPSGLTPEIAYTHIGGANNSIYLFGIWGGYPTFSDMTHVNNAYFTAYAGVGGANPNGSNQWKFSLTQDLQKLNLVGNFQFAYGIYDFKPSNNYSYNQTSGLQSGLNMDVGVIDFAYSCKDVFVKKLSISTYYETVLFADSSAWANVVGGSGFANTKSTTYFKIKASYKF